MKGERQGQRRDNGEAKERRSLFCWRVFGLWQVGSQKSPVQEAGGKPQAAEAQAAATMNQVQSSPPDEDSFWMFVVGAPSGRNARILFESGADEHVCPTDLASATPLGADQGQHALRCTRTRGRSSWRENCVHEARTRRSERGCRIQCHKREITDPQHREVGQTGLQVRDRLCAMSRGNRSLTLDVVKNTLWVERRSLHDG